MAICELTSVHLRANRQEERHTGNGEGYGSGTMIPEKRTGWHDCESKLGAEKFAIQRGEHPEA
jgi:hypothetical protein